MNEKAWSLKFLIMAPQGLKCFKDWIIEGYTKELENPMESSLISATIFCNYPFDSTTLSDMILTLCSDWIRTSCLAAVKMLCVMECGGVSVKGRSQFVLQCLMILEVHIKSSFEMSGPQHYCCPCWKQKRLVIMPQTEKFYSKPSPLPISHCKPKNGDLHLH